jgi:tRNA-dihydrouridine synthase A
MAEPQLVADCCSAMMAASDLPVTVKCRIGIDDMDPEQALINLLIGLRMLGLNILSSRPQSMAKRPKPKGKS